MKIKAFPLEGAESSKLGQIAGKITMPEGSKIVHVGAAPPNGEMYAYAEVSPVTVPDKQIDVVILQEGQDIPNGYKYLGYILAIPILFIYQRRDAAIIT